MANGVLDFKPITPKSDQYVTFPHNTNTLLSKQGSDFHTGPYFIMHAVAVRFRSQKTRNVCTRTSQDNSTTACKMK